MRKRTLVGLLFRQVNPKLTLYMCSARERSGRRYQELWHFDDKADVFRLGCCGDAASVSVGWMESGVGFFRVSTFL